MKRTGYQRLNRVALVFRMAGCHYRSRHFGGFAPAHEEFREKAGPMRPIQSPNPGLWSD